MWLILFQQCHCLTALPAKISVFKSHMQGSHLVSSNEPRLYNKKKYLHNKIQIICVTNNNMSVLASTETMIEY